MVAQSVGVWAQKRRDETLVRTKCGPLVAGEVPGHLQRTANVPLNNKRTVYIGISGELGTRPGVDSSSTQLMWTNASKKSKL